MKFQWCYEVSGVRSVRSTMSNEPLGGGLGSGLELLSPGSSCATHPASVLHFSRFVYSDDFVSQAVARECWSLQVEDHLGSRAVFLTD